MRFMSPYWLFPVLLGTLGGLQYRLWIGEGSIQSAQRLQEQIRTQQAENERLEMRNQMLAAEVAELKSGAETVEERARGALGMVKQNERLYLLAR